MKQECDIDWKSNDRDLPHRFDFKLLQMKWSDWCIRLGENNLQYLAPFVYSATYKLFVAHYIVIMFSRGDLCSNYLKSYCLVEMKICFSGLLNGIPLYVSLYDRVSCFYVTLAIIVQNFTVVQIAFLGHWCQSSWTIWRP